eukprot:gene1611-4747_t
MTFEIQEHLDRLQTAANEKGKFGQYFGEEQIQTQNATLALGILSKELLVKALLVVNGRPHVLLEVEAYLNSSVHPDPYTHCSDSQQHGSCWYFHSKGKSFNGGTYKGLDICIGFKERFGSETKTAYGGILIRAIAELPSIPSTHTPVNSLTTIEGSCLVVEHILKCFRVSSIQDLIDQHFTTRIPKLDGSSAINHTATLSLTSYPDEIEHDLEVIHNLDVDVYNTPRVGLTLKRASLKTPFFVQFFSKPYRFLRRPDDRKGRLHTVLGLTHYHHLTLTDISRICGVNYSTAKKYVDAFTAGQCTRSSKYFGKALSSLELCAALGASLKT